MRQIRDDTVVLTQDPDLLPGAGLPLVIRVLADRIQWGPVVDQLLPWDRNRTQTPPSVLLLGLVMNVLSHRTPLYHVERWMQSLPCDLFWGPGVTAAAFNDDALGRALEKLADHGPAVLGTLGARIQALAAEGPQILHTDTTSFSLFGDYPDSTPDGPGPFLTWGYSKARRPDLKQLLLGLTTDQHGQVLLGAVLDGNASDKAWIPAWLETLDREVPDTAWKDALYVTDSAGITPATLERCAALGVHGLGRLPETYGLARTVKAEAWAQPETAWTDLGTFSPKQRAAHYRAQIREGHLAGHAVRCVVVHSDALDQRREKALQREIATERATLTEMAQALARQRFACAADAEQAHATTVAAIGPRWHRVTATVTAETVPVRRRGRPRRDAVPETTTVYQVQWTVAEPEAAAVQAERQRRSTFVLVTNDPSRSARELVAAYKGQDHVEHAFRWAKHPWHLQAFWLQNPRRIAGLGFLLLLALQMVRWMRRMVRAALRDQPPLALPDGRKLPAPSDEVILETLRPLWLRRRWTHGRPWYQWGHVPPHAQRVLTALGVPLYVRFEPG